MHGPLAQAARVPCADRALEQWRRAAAHVCADRSTTRAASFRFAWRTCRRTGARGQRAGGVCRGAAGGAGADRGRRHGMTRAGAADRARWPAAELLLAACRADRGRVRGADGLRRPAARGPLEAGSGRRWRARRSAIGSSSDRRLLAVFLRVVPLLKNQCSRTSREGRTKASQ